MSGKKNVRKRIACSRDYSSLKLIVEKKKTLPRISFKKACTAARASTYSFKRCEKIVIQIHSFWPEPLYSHVSHTSVNLTCKRHPLTILTDDKTAFLRPLGINFCFKKPIWWDVETTIGVFKLYKKELVCQQSYLNLNYHLNAKLRHSQCYC